MSFESFENVYFDSACRYLSMIKKQVTSDKYLYKFYRTTNNNGKIKNQVTLDKCEYKHNSITTY